MKKYDFKTWWQQFRNKYVPSILHPIIWKLIARDNFMILLKKQMVGKKFNF
jgi:hypothetical protein